MPQDKSRTILHCDCNGFYASVECLLFPKLKEVPMAVCGDPESRRGIILAKNELAKGFGIQTAETIWQAKKKCPKLVLVPPHREEYQKYSKLCNEIYRRYTDLVEPFGIDESWLDVTGTRHLFGEGKEIADTLRKVVREETGLTISVGVSFCKVFAKLGSDYRKPDATTVIDRDNMERIVWPLPVSALLYVGDKAAEKLKALQINTIGDLAKSDPKVLQSLLGKQGKMLYDYALGKDHDLVASAYADRAIKSVGHGMTFRRNLLGIEEIRTGICVLADQVAFRLRQAGLCALSIQVVIKDPEFHSISRQKPLQNPTHLADEIEKAALELLFASWNIKNPIRMISITAKELLPEEEAGEQQSLFEPFQSEEREKKEKLSKTLDGIRNKFGKEAIGLGAELSKELGFGEESPHLERTL